MKASKFQLAKTIRERLEKDFLFKKKKAKGFTTDRGVLNINGGVLNIKDLINSEKRNKH